MTRQRASYFFYFWCRILKDSMFFSPLTYEEPLFRPPSEANSLIFQTTIGCSWNKCAFCEMYTSKKFKVRPESDVLKEIKDAAEYYPATRKVFLADGNAMVLSYSRLLKILECIKENLSKVIRVSAYAGARDLDNKSEDELRQLNQAGLKLLYVGIESGDDELLDRIHKGETASSIEQNLKKARKAGLKISVMILNGLGGSNFSHQHAINSARLVSAIQPEFLSTLVLSYPYGVEHYKSRFNGPFVEMDKHQLLKELYEFLNATKLNQTVFRSDHASNYLSLKGILDRDKVRLMELIDHALAHPGSVPLREEWQRGL